MNTLKEKPYETTSLHLYSRNFDPILCKNFGCDTKKIFHSKVCTQWYFKSINIITAHAMLKFMLNAACKNHKNENVARNGL